MEVQSPDRGERNSRADSAKLKSRTPRFLWWEFQGGTHAD